MPTAIEEALKKLEGTHLAAAAAAANRTASGSPTNSQGSASQHEMSSNTGFGNGQHHQHSQYQQAPKQQNINNAYSTPEMTPGRSRSYTNTGHNNRSSALFTVQGVSPNATTSRPLNSAEISLMNNMPEDAIPNSIVVKNINFEIKREELLQTMVDRGLPLPYAFNYHYEGGLFRGLAFANFYSPEEAAQTFVGLNGITLLGRTIKVEYKKALPGMTPAECMARQKPHMHQQGITPDIQSLSIGSRDGVAGTVRTRKHTISHVGGRTRGRPQSMMVGGSPMPVPDTKNNTGIDLDDKDTRLLYDLISQFRHDKSMVELEFPSALSDRQRHCVMMIAERFGLNHETKGDFSTRFIRVYKSLGTLLEATEIKRRPVHTNSGMSSNSTLSRSSTGPANSSAAGRQRPVSAIFDIMQPPSSSTGNKISLFSPTGVTSRPEMPQPSGYPFGGSESFGSSTITLSSNTGLGLGIPPRGRSLTTVHTGNFTSSPQTTSIASIAQNALASPTGFRSPPPTANSRMSGTFNALNNRLFGDAVVVPVRQPNGPDINNNFAARAQKQQRQEHLKTLQLNRQRRLSDAASPSPNTAQFPLSPIPGIKIANKESKAIPIVDPKSSEPQLKSESTSTKDNSEHDSEASGLKTPDSISGKVAEGQSVAQTVVAED
ncbi:Peptidyl-prolyl cis-trans isomerase pin4 [Mycoemilia scoparia]|uniref:Peptidyl-prolyl cis-trans isomerase pin4 n=1 Tax=Mycoemilia scoparia TaxID=417184 RepID=A0A9W8A0U3_9FUNG|nr:Peptidyl-prolyl cis-trans isomerase pin4 [Mycoemilia scoparia]